MAERVLSERELAKIDAEREVALSQVRLNEAQARLDAANARKAEAEAERAEMLAAVGRLELADAEEADRRSHAADDYHHTYRFNDAVTATSVRNCLSKLSVWDRIDPGCDIEIIFNSPGGSVIDGFALWDTLIALRTAGHRLTTVCRGMAASMAGILLQAGDVRVMGAESVLLVHEISFGAGGKIGEVEDEVAFAKMLTRRVLHIFADRTRLSAAQIDRRWKRKDWWLDSDEALRLGFCDEIR